jgi:formate hydrogenlyase subunit 3/multisubunit Na+/H+ antiporter MnhD subunit
MSIAPESPPPAPRSGFLTAVMVLVGIILLLPGLCAVIFGLGEFTGSSVDPTVMLLVLIGLALGAVGIWLIWNAIRGPRR